MNFTETARLVVEDKSSPALKRINENLAKLFATADKLKGSKNLGLDVNASKLAAAEAALKKISAELKALKSAGGEINIRANTSQASSQIRRLRAEAGKPITLRTVAAFAAAHGIATKAWEGVKVGTKQADIGKTSLDQLQLDDARRKRANAEVKATEDRLKAMPGPYQFNAGIVERRMAENLRQEREGEAAKAYRIPLDPNRPQDVGDPKRSRAATAAEATAESQRRMNVAAERTYQELLIADQIAKDSGKTSEQAVEGIQAYYRGLDMAGWLSNEAGQNTVENLQKTGAFIRTMRGAIGQEATGEFFAHLVRREKAAKFALTEKGQLGVAMIAEDMGAPTAGTALSTWMNQTMGARITSAAREAQAKAGMVSGGHWEGKGFAKKFVGTTVDSELAATDPLAYARQRLVPALQKSGMSEKEIYSQTPEAIAKMSNIFRKLYSDTNAANFAIEMTTHLLELESKTRDAYTRSADPKVMAEATKNSIQASTNAMASSFEGLTGQAVVAFSPIISKTADALSTGISSAAADIKTAGDATQDMPTRVQAGTAAATKIGLAITGPMVALKGISEIFERTGAAGVIGKGAAISGMVSGDTATKATSGAAFALIEAADALKGAAADLSGAAGKSPFDLPGGPGGEGKGGPGKGGIKNPGLWQRMKKWFPTIAETGLSWGVRGGILGGLFGVTAGTLDPGPEGKAAAAMIENVEKLNDAKMKLQHTNQEMRVYGKAEGRKGASAEERADYHSKIAELEKEAAALKAEIAQRDEQRKRDAKIIENIPTTPTVTDDAAKKEAEAEAAKKKADEEERAAAAKKKADTEATKPATFADRFGATTPAPGATPVAAAESQAETASAITAASASLAGTSSLFAAAFSTGASQIAAAGQTAADIIAAGASGAGAAYGAAAAAAIAGAVANVNINVNQKGGGADTGNLKAAPNNG